MMKKGKGRASRPMGNEGKLALYRSEGTSCMIAKDPVDTQRSLGTSWTTSGELIHMSLKKDNTVILGNTVPFDDREKDTLLF